MTDRITRIVILVVAACLGTTVAGPAQGQLTPALNNKVETVTTLPALGNTENIGQGPDGSLYITGMADRILWKVSPNGHVENFFSVPSLAAFLGVATNKNEIVLGAFQRPFRRPAPAGSQGAAPTNDMSNVGSQILVLDKAGKLKATIEGRDGQFFNGIARAGDGWYLITDSNGTALLRLDTAKRRIEPWLKDDLLTRANGIKVHDGWVYVGSSGDKLYRVQIDSKGKPKGGLMLFEQGVRIDDFAIAPDGTIYIPSGTKIMKVSPAGEVSQFLDNVPNGASAWVTKDGKWLYWATRAGPSQLLRVALK